VPSSESLPAKSANEAASQWSAEGACAAATSGTRDPQQAQTAAWLWVGAACAFVVGNLFWGLGSAGLWDPWEFDVAAAARHALDPRAQPVDHVDLGVWLVSRAFAWFGASDRLGRVPIAAAAGVCAAAAFEGARRCSGLRVGAHAALIAATTPLLIFNGRTLFGAAPDMASSGCLGVTALAAVWPATSEPKDTALRRAVWFSAAVALIAVNTLTRGALLAVVPPLGAAVAVAFVSLDAATTTTATEADKGLRRGFALALTAAFLAVLGLIARDVLRDTTDYSPWLGGAAHKLNPPTFDAVIERVFHGFAPWSACLPLALNYAWSTDNASAAPQKHALYTACSVWIALAYGAHTLFAPRYGADVAFLAVVPLAVWVAVALADLAREPRTTGPQGSASCCCVACCCATSPCRPTDLRRRCHSPISRCHRLGARAA